MDITAASEAAGKVSIQIGLEIYTQFNRVTVLGASKTNSLGWDYCLKAFENRCRGINVTDRTWGTYLFNLSRFIAWIPYKPQEIAPGCVGEYIGWQRSNGWADYTLHGSARAIKTFLTFLKAEGLIDTLPALPIPILPQKIPVAFTDEKIKKLLACLDPKTDFGVRDKALYLFFADTGARLEEVCNLRLTELDLRLGTALLHGKGRKDRIVGFGLATGKALGAWILRRPDLEHGFVFCNRYGTKFRGNTIEQQLKKSTVKAGINALRLNCHAFRHYCAISMLRNGADPKSVQRQLGHDDLSMTMKYVNLLESESVAVTQRASPVDRAGLAGYGAAMLKR